MEVLKQKELAPRKKIPRGTLCHEKPGPEKTLTIVRPKNGVLIVAKKKGWNETRKKSLDEDVRKKKPPRDRKVLTPDAKKH